MNQEEVTTTSVAQQDAQSESQQIRTVTYVDPASTVAAEQQPVEST